MIPLAQEKLHRFSIAILIFNTQAGVVQFILPRTIATHFGTNGWIVVIPVYLAVSLNIVLINTVYRLGKGKSIFAILEGGLPKWFLVPIYLFVGGIFAMIGCLVVKQYVLIYQMIVFPSTSDMLMKIFIDILVFLFVSKGIYNMSKANMMIVFILFAILPTGFMLLNDLDVMRLTPYVFKEGKDWLQGFANVYAAFMGYELSLLLFPYAEKNTKWLKYVHFGNSITMFIYLSTTLLCYGFFSYLELVHLSFPLLDMFGYLQFSFVERIQNFLFSVFLLSMIVTAGMYFWSSQQIYSAVFTKIPWKLLLLLLMLTSIGVSYIPKSLIIVEKWFRVLSLCEIGAAISLPILAILAILIQRGKGQTE